MDRSWDIYDDDLPFAATYYGEFNARMVVIGIGNGNLLVVTPGAQLEEPIWQRLAEFGTPKYLLAPNHFHWFGIPEWKKRFPEARVVAHTRAVPRLRKKLRGIDVQDLTELEKELPRHIELRHLPMAKQGETWVSLETKVGRTWFVTDAVLNETQFPKHILSPVMRWMGFGPGLVMNPFFRRVFLESQKAYNEWFEAALDRDKPVFFVPAHGAILQGPEVVAQLRATMPRL